VWLQAHSLNSQQAMMEPLLAHHFFNSNLNLHILPNDFTNGNLFEWRCRPARRARRAHAAGGCRAAASG
jgi:hypothetical protein